MRVPLATAAAIGEVDVNTIRQWARRGHIGRYRDGDPDGEYETTELLLWLEQRDTNKARAGKVAAGANYNRQRVA